MKPRLVYPPDRPPTQQEIEDSCPLEIPPPSKRRVLLLVLIEVVIAVAAVGIVLWEKTT